MVIERDNVTGSPQKVHQLRHGQTDEGFTNILEET